MKIHHLYLLLILLLPFGVSQAQTSQGAEIVTHQKFGEGLMVTKAKMVPISGTVSNIFFYNRADEPWNGNVWYEYDWELRGAHPENAWSQIRVRENNGGRLKDAPINISISENIGEKFFHYVLIRQGNQYVYDIREAFDIASYDYTIATAHGDNSASVIVGGPRIFNTGSGVADIPTVEKLDFSLGITAFDNNWSGALPNGAYSGDYVVDFTRFHEFSGTSLNTTPQWQDEFNTNNLDTSKWFAADWTYADTLFSTDNIKFENGHIILTVNRDQNSNVVSTTNLSLSGQTTQSSTAYNGEASRAIDDNTNGVYRQNSVTHTANETNAWWKLDLAYTSQINQIVIYNRADSCCVSRLSDFSVSVLDENNDVVWTQFYSNYPESELTINLNATGQSVKINRNGVLSLAEVRVYGTAGTQANANLVVSIPEIKHVNLALLGEATQSTTGAGGDASRAIDNQTSGMWNNNSVTRTDGSDGSWWQVKLAQESELSQIIIFNRTDKCCNGRLVNFTVSVLDSLGNVTWSQFYEEDPIRSLTIDLSVTGQTVQVSLDGVLSLAEVQVIGPF